MEGALLKLYTYSLAEGDLLLLPYNYSNNYTTIYKTYNNDVHTYSTLTCTAAWAWANY